MGINLTINPKASYRRDLIHLFLAVGLLFCLGLGARPYLIPSEARYIELPRQMLATEDWLTPRINGVPYFEKPPLFYWMQALVMHTFGMGEFAGRFMTALLTTFTCLTTYALARLLYGRASGLLAAGVLASSVMGYGLSRVATLDVPVSLFISACLACFLAAQHTQKKSRKRNRYLLMYVASALAVMTKGLIGIVIPGLVIGAWIAILGRWRLLKEVQLIAGTLIFLAITVQWHLLMAQTHPDFLNFYFIHEHFTRYMTNEHKRTAPWWFFIAVTWVGFLPWSGLLPSVFKKIQWREPNTLFLLLWILLPLLFFSTSHSKLVPYIFPIFPPLCILLGHRLSLLWNYSLPLEPLRRNAILVIIVFGVLILVTQLSPVLSGNLGMKINAVTSSISFIPLLPMVAVLLWLSLILLRPCPTPRLILSLLGFGMVTGITANFMAGSLDKASTKSLAVELLPQLKPLDIVAAYDTYWQDLPVYLGRNITVVGWTGELTFGVEHYPETHDWMISPETFWKRCATSTHNVFVFINSNRLEDLKSPSGCHLKPIASYGKTILMKKESR